MPSAKDSGLAARFVLTGDRGDSTVPAPKVRHAIRITERWHWFHARIPSERRQGKVISPLSKCRLSDRF